MFKFRSTEPATYPQLVKRFSLSTFVVFSFLAYIFQQRFAISESTKVYTSPIIPNTFQLVSRNLRGAYRDGVYIGPGVKAGYGNVQVQAVIQNGKISDIQFLDYPNQLQTSEKINSHAMPLLQQEAIRVQNARINIVSGATLTSQAFATSLQVALDSAGN